MADIVFLLGLHGIQGGCIRYLARIRAGFADGLIHIGIHFAICHIFAGDIEAVIDERVRIL